MGKYLVIGGAGFIGCNSVARFLSQGKDIAVIDDLSRKGTQSNLDWLKTLGKFDFHKVDIRDFDALRKAIDSVGDIEVVLHLAAQVAVTTSVLDPREDFEINALGTFNVLEAVRLSESDPFVIYASTNKVYGGMEDVAVSEEATRYVYTHMPEGASEERPLDFHSPYGCSKGAADQYVRDYARIYGMKTVVMRQSCIYGYRQFGVEDQGWVAWFIIATVLGRSITIYGDGKQVRDVLFIDDLVDAYEAVIAHRDKVSGKVYNIGGGPENVMAVWAEFGPIIEELAGRPIEVSCDDWRPGDQRVCVYNIDKAKQDFGWSPKVGVKDGIERLYNWVSENKNLFD